MPDVLRVGEINPFSLANLLSRYQLDIRAVDSSLPIPGSFWGEQEAGLIKNSLYLREDTPVHSALHESCHFICLDEDRRLQLHTDAGSNVAEENAVCYLQILLADELPCIGRSRMLADMDNWGYSFRLGSSKAWFDTDADDARDWLIQHSLINQHLRPTFQRRQSLKKTNP